MTFTGTPQNSDTISITYTKAAAAYGWENIEVQPAADPLPSQSGNSGKFLTTDGTDASWGEALVNKATGTESIGIGGDTLTQNYATSIGIQSYASSEGVAVGYHARTGNYLGSISIGRYSSTSGSDAVAIGNYAIAKGDYSVAIGCEAKTTANYAIQISSKYGYTNNDANTFKVGNNNGNFEIMSADGTIPEDRLADTTSATSGQVLQLDSNNNAVWKNIISTPSTIPTLLSNSWTENPITHEITQTVSVTGVTLTNLIMVGPTPVSAEDYNDSDVICIAQGVDTLTFKCATIPSVDLTLNVLCF